MSEFVIKCGVPLPPKSKHFKKGGGKLQKIMKQMDIGDMVEAADWKKVSCFNSSARSLGFKVANRKLPNGKIGVWRTA